MIEARITILNRRGLHARAATRLVEVVENFSSTVEIGTSDNMVPGHNIMQVMSLVAVQGAQLHLRVSGEDEQQALQAIKSLIDSRFGEEE